jgi:mannose-6-phosphate isomerase
MNFYPFKFEGLYKERIWGGRRLEEDLGRDLPEGVKIGESWEIADLPEGESVIANGELAGKTLAEAISEYPKEIMADESFTGQFPLLIKILDAQDVLSVQVHPDKEACERMGKGEPKTECWYILSAESGAVIYKGLKEGVTKEQFSDAIKNGTCAELLVRIEVTPGECHFLPAGTAHAIGAGLMIAEIQLPSDTTYRVFDWNRLDDSGKGRQLHVEEALESIHFDPSGDDLSVRTVGRLVDSKYFKIDKRHQAKDCEMLLEDGGMKVVIVLKGAGKFARGDQISTDFKEGESILVPAAYEGAMLFDEDTEFLVVTI